MLNVALLASSKVDGNRADPGERVTALCLLGSMNLDFTSAQPPPEVQVLIVSLLGSVNLQVRPEQEVKLSGFGLLSGRELDPIQPDGDEFSLPLEVAAYSLLGSVSVKRKSEEQE